MEFRNTYEDPRRAAAYDELELGGTYYLVFHHLPSLLAKYVKGVRAVDFGCGTGRSTRFLQKLGFVTTGLDISEEMVAVARQRDPEGVYRVMADGDFQTVPKSDFDLVVSAFTFDNIPGFDRKVGLFRGLRSLLAKGGTLVNIVSTPEMYTHEWATFSTRDYPNNRLARCGDVVSIVTTDYSDARPVEDIVWPHADYLRVFQRAGLEVLHVDRPLAVGDEGIAWKSETRVAPWAIYLLGNNAMHETGGQGDRMISLTNIMKRAGLTLCIPLLLLASARPALAQQTSREQEIRTAVLAFGDAFAKADVPTLQTMLTTDYIHVSGSTGNVLSRDEWLNWVTSRRAELDRGVLIIGNYTVEDVKVQVYGNAAVVTGVVHSNGRRNGVSFASSVRFTNVWVQQEGIWRRAAFHDSPL